MVMTQRGTRRSAKRSSGARKARTTPRRRRAASRAGSPRAGSGRPVVHFEINARDPRTLHSFYASLFGWKISADNPMNYGIVQAGTGGINGGIGPAEGVPFVTFYVRVPDLEAALAKAGQLGGRTVVPPTHIPNMVTYAVFTDPEGNRIGLVK
jgi:uncharacterized protein